VGWFRLGWSRVLAAAWEVAGLSVRVLWEAVWAAEGGCGGLEGRALRWG